MTTDLRGLRRRRVLRLIAGAVLGAWLVPVARADEPLPVGDPSLVRIRVGGQPLAVEVAADPASRSRGLMFREHLPQGRGMLFIWPRAGRHGMWMKNTLIPLDVAFLTGDLRIAHIATMMPRSTRLHRAPKPVRYALEVNAGWFARHGIGEGDRLQGLATLTVPVGDGR